MLFLIQRWCLHRTRRYGIWKQYPYSPPLCDKASHLALHPGNVQSRNVLLATLALNANDVIDGFTLTPKGNLFNNLATNMLLPVATSEAPVLVLPSGAVSALETSATTPFAHDVPIGSTVAIRMGPGMLAVKVFAADGLKGQAPTLQLKADGPGIALGAMRLVVQHYLSSVPSNLTGDAGSHVRYAALIVADGYTGISSGGGVTGGVHGVGELAAFAAKVAGATTAATTNAAATVWSASAHYDGHQLDVLRNLTCSETPGLVANQTVHQRWNCLISRSVNGSEIVPGPLKVNGVAVAPLH